MKRGRRKSTLTRTIKPLTRGSGRTIALVWEQYGAIEYDFYIPAAIWSHSATKTFLQNIGKLAEGSTVFQGAGVSRGEAEDTNIYRLIVPRKKSSPRQNRIILRNELANLIAKYAEWAESKQQSVLFTERDVRVGLVSLTK